MSEVKLVVQRFDPFEDAKPRMKEYAIPRREGMTVLDALLYARDYLDHSIGVRFSCRQASCGSCGMKINGRPRLACYTQVAELGGDKVVAQPMDNFAIIKDLVTDMESFFEKHREMMPYLIRADAQEMERPSAEYVMEPKELEKVLQFTYCIKCGLCTSSCPTVATDSKFPGPQALAQAYRYTVDPRDEGGGKRLELLDDAHGVWRCHFAGSCSFVCPKGVDPALGIQLLKRHVLSGRPPRREGEGAKVWTAPVSASAQK
ncbi:MAG TPA: succinate dehydrogenase/fumarate reductase iron-sulfur subunit [Nitrososphaerales archaeon]|nr:succinate dehydrogenase/fumarate reductase iron-sulfur subunit [Nitrososphaerales archaeon]